jgi:hypothetical protein
MLPTISNPLFVCLFVSLLQAIHADSSYLSHRVVSCPVLSRVVRVEASPRAGIFIRSLTRSLNFALPIQTLSP